MRLASRLSAGSLGPQDEQTLRSINQLGLLLQDRGKLDEADALADEYEHGVRCLWGTKHPDNVTAMASLARVRLSQGRLDVAELLYEAPRPKRAGSWGRTPRTLAADDYARVLRRTASPRRRRVLAKPGSCPIRRGLDDPET